MTNALPAIGPSNALKAYQSVDGGQTTGLPPTGQGGEGFAAMLGRALDGAVATGHSADAQAQQAISGHGDLTQVVTAVSRAELALQTTVAVRDRVIAAYQDIIKMPI
jgi:flagellar hook-basal body complex protein FliE